jgi:cytochrome b561
MLFHWLIALFIVVNVLLIWTVDYAPKPDQRPMIDLHKSIGITVLGLAIMRLLWRFANKPPAFPAAYKPWERYLAHGVHIGLYVLIFCLPLSGWIHDSAWKDAAGHPLNLYWVIPWFRLGFVTNLDPAMKEQMHGLFGAVHTSLAYVLYAMFVLHVGGALKHQFWDKERELQRILPL